MRTLSVRTERFPVAGAFTISRGARTEALVVTATVADADASGRGECVPYARYGETPQSVTEALLALAAPVAAGLTRHDLQRTAPAGAARNALDCALWDWEAKRANRPVWDLAGLPAPKPVITAQTISVAAPDIMAQAARRLSAYPLLKIKLSGMGDASRIAAVRAAAPAARLIVDANEAWSPDIYAHNMAACVDAGVELVEQPLPAQALDVMRQLPRPIPVCADESAHDRASLAALRGACDAVNIKLDKTGGLTEAIAMAQEARAMGFKVMLGCMLSSSLSMAQAMILAPLADWVDLDGPLLLAADRTPAMRYQAGLIYPAHRDIWG
jgi:L-alanine-DL-glutamate epimerase-like enolase superfamily enzyme